jgi:DNA invertase Pin-like site-specific DNA recombinase
MSKKALVWIRKSEGSDDDVGLEVQREKVHDLADDIADETSVVDLGVHTGFSSLSRDKGETVDGHPKVNGALDELRGGEYDVLVAHDSSRIARDGFLHVVRYAAVQGNARVEFVEPVEDELARDVRRVVERFVKQDEIQKAREAIRERQRRGFDHGRPPFGYTFDDDGEYWVRDPEEFETAVDVLALRDDGATYDEIVDETGVPRATVAEILDNRDRYGTDATKNVS